MIVNLGIQARNAMMTALQALMDAQTAPARIELRASPMPGTAGGTAGIGAVQCVVVLSKPCGSVADGALTLAMPAAAQRSAGEPITWARITDGADGHVMDMDVTLTGGGGAVQLDVVNGYTGAFITLTGAALQF